MTKPRFNSALISVHVTLVCHSIVFFARMSDRYFTRITGVVCGLVYAKDEWRKMRSVELRCTHNTWDFFPWPL